MDTPIFPQIADIELMGENLRGKLKKCAKTARLYPLCKIGFPELVELGEHSRIRDFAFIFAGIGVKIGDYTDMQPHTVIWGGGETIIGNRVSVGPGTVLLTAVYSHGKGLKMVDGFEEGSSKALYGKLEIQDDVYIGANCTIMPDIVIGEGSVVGAGSFVNKDVEPWSIVVGSPAKKIGVREK
ncbi:MAG: acyltransferase [Desulfobacula sp.]|jgi:galactoside O-acetyltransferase